MGGKYLPPGMHWNMKGWNGLVAEVVDKDLVPRAEVIAAACNDESESSSDHKDSTSTEERRGYRAGTEGSKTLEDHSYRATVITATYAAMADNARNNRLVNNLHHAESVE